MSDKQSAVIVGGSLGGLTAAICLRDIGFSVSVFERCHEYLSGKGAGIALNPSMLSFIQDHPRFRLSEHGRTIRKYRHLDHGREDCRERNVTLAVSSYNSVYKALLEIFGTQDYHLGQNVMDVSQSSEKVSITTADGERYFCDLLVCADGSGSNLRQIFALDKEPTYAGYYAWRGIVNKSQLSACLARDFEESLSYHMSQDGHILSYPIPYFEADENGKLEKSTYINWLWYRNFPHRKKLENLLVDATGKRRLKSVPRGCVSSDRIEELRNDARILQDDFRQLVNSTQDPFIQPIFDYATKKMVVGRMCLLGDAAFSVRPHVAVGTAKAWDDAVSLAYFLKQPERNLHSALRTWEEKQLLLGNQLLKRSVELGTMLQTGAFNYDQPPPFGLHEAGDSYNWSDALDTLAAERK
ncbi:unnamed protein product [Agarophyton chilense]